MTQADTLYKSFRKQKIIRAIQPFDNGGMNADKFLCIVNHNRNGRTNNVKRLNELGYECKPIDLLTDNLYKFALIITLK